MYKRKRLKQKIRYLYTLLFLICTVSVSASVPVPASSQVNPVALINGTVHPVTSVHIPNGKILFTEGKITAIGAHIRIPPNAEIVDIKGKHVYPALIESYSQLGLYEVGAVKSTRDMSEMGRFNPNIKAEIAVNAESELIPVTRANGVAMAITRPGRGLISGKAALLMLDGWTWEEMTYQAPVSLIVNWPVMRTHQSARMSKSEKEQKKQITENIDALYQFTEDSKAYMKAREAEKSRQKFDARFEAMIPVLQNKLPVWIQASSLRQIESAVAWAGKYNLNIVIVGGTDAPLAAYLLKPRAIPVIAVPIHTMPRRRDSDFDEPFSLPAKLYAAGIQFCIASGSSANARNLPYHAAKAAAYGLPKEEALKAITLYPAQIMGTDKTLGSLEKGKDATLIVTTGDPLEITTQVEKLYIQGRDTDLNNKHLFLYHKYQARYNQ